MSIRVASAVLGLAAAFTLSACTGLTTPTSQPSDRPSTTPTGTSVYDLTVGDCFDADLATLLETVDPEDCAAAHHYEIYASLLEADGDYPGSDAIGADAQSRCTSAFADFVGIRYEDSKLAIDFLAPTRSDWTAGSREVLCFLSDPSGPLTGSTQQTAQ